MKKFTPEESDGVEHSCCVAVLAQISATPNEKVAPGEGVGDWEAGGVEVGVGVAVGVGVGVAAGVDVGVVVGDGDGAGEGVGVGEGAGVGVEPPWLITSWTGLEDSAELKK